MGQDDRKRLEDMRQNYENIPAPDVAKDRILAGINQAKKKERMETMMKIIKRTGLTAAAAWMTVTVMTNVSPAIANAMEDIPVIGAIAKVMTFRTFEDNTGNHEAKIDVPKVTLGDDKEAAVNRSVEEYANELIRQYETDLAADQGGEGHYSMESTYDVVTDNDRYLSLRIRTTVTMASGAQFVKIFTVDKTDGRVISLREMFQDTPETLTAIGDSIKAQMEEQMAEDEGVMYFYGSGDESMDEFTGIDGEESYYFNQAGELVIVFDEYEVAPGYMGAVEFTIPADVTGL